MGLRKPIPKQPSLAEMTADATATGQHILKGYTAYSKGVKYEGVYVYSGGNSGDSGSSGSCTT